MGQGRTVTREGDAVRFRQLAFRQFHWLSKAKTLTSVLPAPL